jgi:hypothetical protein
MEHSTKMTLVPTTEAELHRLSELDSEITNILKNKELNQDDKIKLYTNVLGKHKNLKKRLTQMKILCPIITKIFKHLQNKNYFQKMFFSRKK